MDCLPSILDNPLTCPGLFYATPAQDGIISRIRIPGGILTTQQTRVVAEYATCFGGDKSVHVTNRANLQVRGVQVRGVQVRGVQVRGVQALQAALFSLQQVRLAGIAEVDHIRNIMASPTAGIDQDELIDTRYLVRDLDNYIQSHREVAGLSPKFSVAFDGGGISICQQVNEITFAAVKIDTSVYFHLLMAGEATNILLKPEQCLFVVAALVRVYLNEVDANQKRKPRLKKLFQDKGILKYLQQAQSYLPFPLTFSEFTYNQRINTNHHLGVHPQRQEGFSYIGVVLPLGKLDIDQLYQLATLADTYGGGSLRLTPWQNLIISDIRNEFIPQVQEIIKNMGLHWSATHIYGNLVACTGNKGCAASATDTKGDALVLAEYLQQHITFDVPIKIHFTGCSKSCAYHGKSDITLLGASQFENGKTIEGYQVFVGSYKHPFGREIYSFIHKEQVPKVILRLVQVYKIMRVNNDESFGECVDRYTASELQRWFHVGGIE
ncbi:MAG: precorrin-3B synthase [Calothrix sp. C42_A2020_038]|nr:precorrin-3B synthase [Calothrix sp. C42_A2020_038]